MPSADQSTKPAGCLIIGLCGGSGSGKSTIAQALVEQTAATLISHDNYYRDLSHLPPADRGKQNFDHPDALETDLLVTHLRRLRGGQFADVPVYDFETHCRTDATTRVFPTDIVIVEGILILAHSLLRSAFDLTVFVDAPSQIRLLRRIKRDSAERGRSEQSVREQWRDLVEVMHNKFVSPHAENCELNVDGTAPIGATLTQIVTRIEKFSPSEKKSRSDARFLNQ